MVVGSGGMNPKTTLCCSKETQTCGALQDMTDHIDHVDVGVAVSSGVGVAVVAHEKVAVLNGGHSGRCFLPDSLDHMVLGRRIQGGSWAVVDCQWGSQSTAGPGDGHDAVLHGRGNLASSDDDVAGWTGLLAAARWMCEVLAHGYC